MVNKNDTSDLKYFFLSLAGVIIFLTVSLGFGIWVINQKFGNDIRFISAKISDYVQQQWQQKDEKNIR